eukprot:scaffold96102_cov38-Prasinocladus_malaysianus.AAC.1
MDGGEMGSESVHQLEESLASHGIVRHIHLGYSLLKIVRSLSSPIVANSVINRGGRDKLLRVGEPHPYKTESITITSG